MIDGLAAGARGVAADLSPADVLSAIRDRKAVEEQAAADQLVLAAPLVAEFCVAELGTVLGISPTAAKKLIGHALELRHRLPRLREQVHAGAGARMAGKGCRGDDHPYLARADP